MPAAFSVYDWRWVILLIDGFDFCDPNENGWNHSGGATTQRSTTTKRNGTHALRVANSNGNYLVKSLDTNYATLYYGFAVYHTNLTSRQRICAFIDGSSYQITLTLETDGSVRVWRGRAGGFDGIGSATSLGQSSAGVITAASWHSVQLKGTIHGSTGVYEVRVNSNVVLSGSGANTSNSGNAYAGKIGIGDVVPSGDQFIDDLWCSDVTFQGDCVIETLYPSANGTTNNFTATGAASNYQCVDDASDYNSDTDYVASSNVGNIDLFAVGDLVHTTGTVKGFCVNAVMRKDDAGARTAALVVRSSATNSVRSTRTITETYAIYQESFTTDPVTSAALTIASINALEIGAKLIS